MPSRVKCQKLINDIARGVDVADVTFMLQAICLELLELRARANDYYSILKGSGLGYINHHHNYNDCHYGDDAWEDADVKSRRPAA